MPKMFELGISREIHNEFFRHLVTEERQREKKDSLFLGRQSLIIHRWSEKNKFIPYNAFEH